MTKILVGLLVVLVGVALLFPRVKEQYDTAIYVARTNGYAEAKDKFQPKADPYVQKFADAFCAGDTETMKPYLEAIASRYSVTVDALLASTGFTTRTCVDVRFVGQFRDPLQNIEYVYIVDNGELTQWYVFTFDSDNQVVSVK